MHPPAGSAGIQPQLAPLYDPDCGSAFFEDVLACDHAVNRAIDKILRAFTWDDFSALFKQSRAAAPQQCIAQMQSLGRSSAGRLTRLAERRAASSAAQRERALGRRCELGFFEVELLLI